MERIVNVIIEFADNNLSAYIENVDGVVALGENLAEVKSSIKKAIDLYIESSKEMSAEIVPELEGEYELVFKYDLCSFLNAYSSVLGKSALETLTGVNQKQLWHYSSGMKKPSKKTMEKIAQSIKDFGLELSKVEFV